MDASPAASSGLGHLRRSRLGTMKLFDKEDEAILAAT
jgi:hypothetical protein